MKGRRKALLASGGVGLVLLTLFSPLRVPERIDVPGRVTPAQEWVVARADNGAVSTTLRDYRSGAVEATLAAEPARGDAVRFTLGPAASEKFIQAGDTVGGFVSEEAALRLAALAGQVEAARAELELSRAGEKDALVEVARQDLRRAQAALEYAEQVVVRQRALFERGIVSQTELEEAESEWRVASAEAAGAQAMLQASQTGEREEQVTLAEARLEALQEEADILRSRMALNNLIAPISGLVYRVSSPDTLLMVADTSAMAVFLPVRFQDRSRVRPGQEVSLRISEWGDQPRARVVDLRESSGRAAGQAYMMAMAEITSGHEQLTPGLLVQGSILTGRLHPLDFLRGIITDLVAW
ncbi:MAG: hypothetical protein HKN73_10850 [Gemmatimonadetes bacterium]|nr:hypothetical protein [Gemmatimonadota bacterium]